MRENVLKDLQTFYEFPEKILIVNNNSDYYYINKDGKNYVTERNLDLITNIEICGEEKIFVKSSYYSVLDGSLICKTEFTSDIDGKSKDFIKCQDNIKIIRLNKILNINENGVSYLTKEDIKIIMNYKEEEAKTYGMKPKKGYF